MPVTNAKFNRTTIALLLVGLVALSGILAASLWLVGRAGGYAQMVNEVQQLRRAAFLVVDVAQDAETGQRGYLLTREQAYLEPFRGAVSESDAQLRTFRRLAEGRPNYLPLAERLDGLVREKLAELERTVDLTEAGRLEDALTVVRTDRGRVLMDEIRQVSGELVATVDARLAAGTAEVADSAGALSWVLALGGALIVVVVGGSTFLAWRYTGELVAARLKVVEANSLLEERVRERTADLSRANEEIQRFAYIVSHDLRAPLVNIMGFTSELETGLSAIGSHLERTPSPADDLIAQDAGRAVDEDMPEAIGFIRSSTARMDSLINAILRLSREGGRKLSRQRIDMGRLLEAAADSVRHQLNEAAGSIEVRTPMPDMIADRLALEQIFGNLVENAVKYLDPARPGRIVVRGRETHIGAIYEVEDNGRGIAPADHERIFDLFRRAGVQDRPGEGIGLSHVRALVRRLGGEITLESELGRGATFRVSLPKTLPLLRDAA